MRTGTDNARCLISLALLTGQIGRPGTGLHPLRGQNNVQGASDVGLIPMVYPDYQRVEDGQTLKLFEEFWGTKLDPKRGLTVVEIMNAAYDGKIKGMYIEGENPAMSDPDVHHARMGMARLEHLVVQDSIPDGDGVPCRRGAAGLGLPREGRHLHQHQPAGADGPRGPAAAGRDAAGLVDHPGDRPAHGAELELHHPRDVFAELAKIMPSMKNISWDRVMRESSVTYPVDSADGPGNEIIFSEGFPTKSGRGKMVPTDIVPPDELPDASYPLVLSTGRLLEHWHTGAMTRRASTLDSIEPEAVAHMAPQDIERQGFQPGQMIRVSTRRGTVDIKLRSDRDVPQGMVFIPFCFAEAAANLLTNAALDPFGKIPEFKFCAAKVETSPLQQAAE